MTVPVQGMSGSGGFIPFRCDQDGQVDTARLCFNGGTCFVENNTLESSSSFQVCHCPSGYVHDYTVAHIPNCALPSYGLSIICGLLTGLTAIAFLTIVPAFLQQKRYAGRRIIGLLGLHCLINLGVVLSVWIQDGHFQSASVFMILETVLTTRILIDGTLTLCKPIFTLLSQDFEKLNRILLTSEVSSALCQFGCTIVLIVFSYSPDPNAFNSAMFLFQLIFAFTGSLATLCVSQACSSLMNNIEVTFQNNRSDSRVTALLQRLTRLKTTLRLLFVVCLGVLVYPITLLAIGSVPYQYVLFTLIHGNAPCLALIGCRIIKARMVFQEPNRPSFMSRKTTSVRVGQARKDKSNVNSVGLQNGVDTRPQSGIIASAPPLPEPSVPTLGSRAES